MTTSLRHRWLVFLLLLAAAAPAAGCASPRVYSYAYDSLQKSILVFNDAFEKKRSEICATFIHPDKKDYWSRLFPEIKNRVTFDEAEMLSVAYFKDGKPVSQSDFRPGSEFNEAEVTHRYVAAISPGNNLRTLFVKQKWILQGDVWNVIPQLDPFFR